MSSRLQGQRVESDKKITSVGRGNKEVEEEEEMEGEGEEESDGGRMRQS